MKLRKENRHYNFLKLYITNVLQMKEIENIKYLLNSFSFYLIIL